jgi:hypothetical protein
MSEADGGAIWSSVTQVAGGGPTAHFVLAINVSRPWVLQRDDLWPRLNESSMFLSHPWSRAKSCVNGSLAVASGCVAASAPNAALPNLQSRCANANGTCSIGESPFVLLAVHEVPSHRWVVWEEGKYVALSAQRFQAVSVVGSGVRVMLHGAAGELVRLVALRPEEAGDEWRVVLVDTVVGPDGTAAVYIT